MGISVIAASALHAPFPTTGTSRVGLGVAAVIAIPVLAPFLDVARHVVDAEFVGLFGLHGMRLASAVAVVPCHVIDVAAAAELRVTALVAAAGSEFPFRFGGKAEVFARECVQLADEGLAVVPGNVSHGKVVTFVSVAGRIAAHHCLPQCLRHLRLADVVAAQRDLMRGFLVTTWILHFRGGAHSEGAARDIFHAIGDVAHAQYLVPIRGCDARFGFLFRRGFGLWLGLRLRRGFRMLAFVGALRNDLSAGLAFVSLNRSLPHAAEHREAEEEKE